MTLRDSLAQGLVRAAKRIAPNKMGGRPLAIPPHLLTPQQPSAPTGFIADTLQSQMQTAQSPQKQSASAFPPGSPLLPAPGAVTPGGPRQYNYPVGYNVAQLPRGTEATSYATLRQLAAAYEGIRMCERVWFDVLARLKIKVGFLPNVIPDGESEQDPKWRAIAQPAEDFLAKPDGRLPMSQWLVASAKDVLELGLSIIYLNRNRAGDIISLELVDAATVKPIIDERGRQPMPPYPAYQQFVYGVPGGQYTAEQMIDITETSRTDSAYPNSRVDDILLRVNLALRKGALDLTRFTDGAIPEGLLRTSPTSQMSGTDLEEYEQRLNGQLGGNDQLKVRLKVLPSDIEQFIPARQADPNLDLDRFLLNITVGEFGLTMDEIAMTENSNRAVGDSQQNVTYRRVVQPLGTRYTDFFTTIVQLSFDPRLVVSWGGMDEAEDRLAKAQEMDIGVKNGALTPPQWAREMGYKSETEVPNFITVQGGPESVVLLDTLEAIRDNSLQMMQAKLEATQTTTHISKDQAQELDQQVAQSQDQGQSQGQNQGEGQDEFGGEEASPGDESPTDEASPEEAPGDVGDETSSSSPSAKGNTTGTPDDAEKAIDDLIAKAKQGKPQRAVASVTPGAIADEWRRYREVALNRVKRGKPAPTFTSDVLPADEHAWVAARLMTCATADDVRAVFTTAREAEITRYEGQKEIHGPDGRIIGNIGTGAMSDKEVSQWIKRHNAPDTPAIRAMVQADAQRPLNMALAERRKALDGQFGKFSIKALQQQVNDYLSHMPIIRRALAVHVGEMHHQDIPMHFTADDIAHAFADDVAKNPQQVQQGLRGLSMMAQHSLLHSRDLLPDGTIRLFRGTSSPEEEQHAYHEGTHHGGTSWTTDFGVAHLYGQHLITARVPLRAISVTPMMVDYMTAQEEQEYIVDTTQLHDVTQIDSNGASITRARALDDYPYFARQGGQSTLDLYDALQNHLATTPLSPAERTQLLALRWSTAMPSASSDEHLHRFVEARCMICGCGEPESDHGMPYPVMLPSQESNTGCMVALMLPGAIAQQIAITGGEPAEDLHITLAYLGDTVENTIDKVTLLALVKAWAAQQHPLYVDLDDLDAFPGSPEDGKPVILHAAADALHAMRADLMARLDVAQVTDFAQTFPIYAPHVTLAYIPQDAPLPELAIPAQHPVFEHVWVCYGDERYAFPLGDATVTDGNATLAKQHQLNLTECPGCGKDADAVTESGRWHSGMTCPNCRHEFSEVDELRQMMSDQLRVIRAEVLRALEY